MDGNTIYVAYADDHVAVRQGIISLIEEKNQIAFEIEANNGVELIQKLEKAERFPDIVMLDIRMPEMAGAPSVSYFR